MAIFVFKKKVMQKDIPVFKGKNPLLPGAEFLTDPFRFTTGPGLELGDFYRVPFIFRKVFVTTDLEVIRHVLQTNQKNYHKSVAYRNLKMALGNGLVTSEGEVWRRNRRLAQPTFYKTQLEGLFNSMVEVAEKYVGNLTGRAAGPAGLEVEIAEEMMGLTADIVLKTLFSTENQTDTSEIYRIMVQAQDYIIRRTVKPWLTPVAYLDGRHRRFKKDMAWFDANLFGIIEQRRNDPDPPNDLLTMLLQSRYEDTGEPMSDRQLRDEATTLFAAGHETSSNALTWTLYLLAQNPMVMEKLRREIEDVLGGRTPKFADLRELEYTAQVIQEGMRLYPPAFAVGREPQADDEILGVKIPKGSVMFISICGLHRHPKYWERPHDFFPEHFSKEKAAERPKLAYLPFGAGPRMCIGNHFAMMEMQLLLVLLVGHFDFNLAAFAPVEPEPLVTLKPKHGIPMSIRPRRSPRSTS